MPGKAADTYEIAKLLLGAGADPKARTKSWSEDIDAIYLATGSNNRAIFELLLDYGIDPTEALTHAAWKFNEEFSQIALDRGAVPDQAKAGNQPLLNNLIRWGQFKPALWLLKREGSEVRGRIVSHEGLRREFPRLYAELIASDHKDTPRVIVER